MGRIGGHFHDENPLDAALEMGADAAQFFLGDPQGWKAPVVPPGIGDAFAAKDVDVYIHSPYLVNVATANNKIRIPSRKILTQQLEAAASIGAKALIVHGGHVTGGTDPSVGVENWVKAVERVERPIPVLIENTAGGNGAMFRTLEQIARLWDAVGGQPNIGFCLDTCHANSAGIDLTTAVDQIMAITGQIDLVHCNNSRDPFDSGADRHANFDSGTIDPEVLVAVVRAAGAPAICETPAPGIAADIARLQDTLAD
jgi:deoxyribonuclease-4